MHNSFRANLPPLKTDSSHTNINPMNHNTTTAATMATTTNNSTMEHIFDHKAMAQLVPLPSSLPSPSTPAAGVVHTGFDVVNSAPTPILSAVNSSDNRNNSNSSRIIRDPHVAVVLHHPHRPHTITTMVLPPRLARRAAAVVE